MEKTEMTCIACPMGCRLLVSADAKSEVVVENYTCKRGITYGVQEFTNPMRTVTSSVLVTGGKRPLVSVKTKDTVQKAKIPEILEVLRHTTVKAPVAIGDVVVPDVAGTGVDLVATAEG